jgi:putative transposase
MVRRRRRANHASVNVNGTGYLTVRSCALDAAHLIAAVRYVELNPVRARLTERAEGWPWSSARAHLAGRDDGLVAVAPLRDAVGDSTAFLATLPRDAELEPLRRHERTGRLLGGGRFVAELERMLGRRLRPGKPGRRSKVRGEGSIA